METSGTSWNILGTTGIVQARVRLTPTLTHVVTYELVTSGAEDGAMSEVYYRLYGEARGSYIFLEFTCAEDCGPLFH